MTDDSPPACSSPLTFKHSPVVMRYRGRGGNRRPVNPYTKHESWTAFTSEGGGLGHVTFRRLPDHAVIETEMITVPDVHQGHGHARAMLQGLLEHFTGWELVEGGGSNSDQGDGLLARLRETGFPYHLPGCLIDGRACSCAMGGRKNVQHCQCKAHVKDEEAP